MKIKLAGFILASILSIPLAVLSQRGKDGSYTVSSNITVNTYTTLSANATAGANSITVANNALSGANFTGNLAPGDLILIIQMQGARMSIDTTQASNVPPDGWGGQFTCPVGYLWDNNWMFDMMKVADWGKVLDYFNSGKYEQVEVLSVSGTTTINLNCQLQNSYTAAGKVQVVRVPRYVNLTVGAGWSIVPTAWNGSTGGVVAVEVNGDLTIGAGGKISASGRGFRGGSTTVPTTQQGNAGASGQHSFGNGNGATQLGQEVATSAPYGTEGGRKGESIGGYNTEYTVLHSTFGRGAAANGGGGGGFQNAGGGGGANVGTGTYTGKGVPSSAYANSIWNLELSNFAGTVSPGGGRGGYSLSSQDRDASLEKPNLTAWSGDARKENGGLGGHPLALDATRLFMGGGGGAGDQDSGQGGPGGTGGGIVMITCYGTVSGTGSVEADGANGSNSNPLGQPVNIGSKKGNDGGGGAGGGGAIYFKNMSAIPATISLLARGGSGGNHALSLGTGAAQEAGGPGGGGGGGQVTYTSGTPTVAVTGGTNGICTVNTGTSQVSEFPANGATNGASGLTSSSTIYNIIPNNVTICSGNTATLSVTVSGTSPGTLSWYTTQFGGTALVNPSPGGLSYTTPVLTTTTTYYVGTCPGTFRVPVVVTVTSSNTTTFNPVGPICSGATLTLPATSLEGFTGTWSPAINNTATTTYTFTPTAGQCASTATLTVNVTSSPASTFTQVGPICSGGSFTLPTTSIEGYTGTWSPAINNTATTTYTFTPTAGQCASTATMTVTITSSPAATFNQVGPICSGGSLTLPTSSIEGYNGTWSPVINNTATTTYTFTPTAGQCASSATMTVTVNTPVTPTFTQWGPYCQNDILVQVMLPSSSLEGISGVWNPGMVSTAVAGNIVHSFTADAGQCANNTTMTVVVNAQATPTFTQVAPICTGGSFSLPSSSLEGIPGTWSPVINTTTSTPYTFTPNAGQCATTASMTVNVGPPSPPTFNQIPQICTGGSFTLPTTSLEGFTGTWSPVNNNTTTTTYTFTPTAGQCATTATMTVDVGSPITPTFDPWGPFCQNDIIIQMILPETSIEGITGTWNPAMVSTAVAGNIIHTFTPDAGQCANPTTMTVTINALPVINSTAMVVTNENCSQNDGSISGITVSGGTTGYSYSWNNDPALNTLNIATLTSGAYNLIVTDGSGCSAEENVTVSENVAPAIDDAGLTIVQPTCVLNGSVTGLIVTGSNPFTYNWTNTAQTTLNITNLTAGDYSLTVTDNNGCTTNYGPVNLTAPTGATASFNWTPSEPNEGDVVTFTNTSTGSGAISSTWTIQGGIQNTTNASSTFTSEGDYPIVLSIVDANGCVDTIDQNITIFGTLSIPNVISANGDGVNDLFEMQGLKANTELIIIDRWGIVVFKTNDYKNDWGGKDQSGNDLTDGVYTYSYKTTDGKQGHGFVHLIR